MLSIELIKGLKQVNVSADNGKTAERLKEVYGALTRAQKEQLIEMTGQNRHSLYRAERTGLVTAKILLPAAAVCNVSPFWLAGSTDENDGYSDAAALRFLREHGYEKLIQELKLDEKSAKKPRKPRGPNKKKAPEAVLAADIPAETCDCGEEGACECAEGECDCGEDMVITLQFQSSAAHQAAAERLTADEAVYLLRALAIRAACSDEDAQIYDAVKRCLLA